MTPLIHNILTQEGWEGLFQFAKKQSLVGVVWDEVQNDLDKFGGIPPHILKPWVTIVGKIEDKNRLINEVAWRISERFSEDSFASMILKGQGLAQYYPTPLHRQSGDIDIWLWTEDACLFRRIDKIVGYVRKVVPKARICYHHVEFKKIQNTEIEVHFTPSWMYSPKRNKYLQDYFNNIIRNFGSVKPKEGEFNVPSDEFNLVFILLHIFRHIFDEGIGLRQMMDYDMVLRKSTAEDKASAMKHIKALGLSKFTGAVMYVLREAFGTQEDVLLPVLDEREGLWLYSQIMEGGNFGHFKPGKANRKETKASHIKNFAVRIRRSAELMTHYPEEALWAVPWRIWHWGWRVRKGFL